MPLVSIARQSAWTGRSCIRPFASTTGLSNAAKLGDAKTEEEHREARTWLARFNVNSIPKTICDVSFSRASGPGGQNVNKYISMVLGDSFSLCMPE